MREDIRGNKAHDKFRSGANTLRPQLPIKLGCGASAYGIGAVMSRAMADGTDKPVGFASRSLTSAERNYAQIDNEAIALIWGVKKVHTYLYGRPFTLVTDHQPLLSILSPSKGVPTMTSARLQLYALFWNWLWNKVSEHFQPWERGCVIMSSYGGSLRETSSILWKPSTYLRWTHSQCLVLKWDLKPKMTYFCRKNIL